MQFSQEEIDEYIGILKKYETPKPKEKPRCEHQLKDNRIPGFLICEKCGVVIRKIEHTSSDNDYNRCHFKKKSVYDRRYHFEKKVNQVINKFNLNLKGKTINKLYEILYKINDEKVIDKMRKEFERKRLINTEFIIKKILEILKPREANKIEIKNLPKTLELYKQWWKRINDYITL